MNFQGLINHRSIFEFYPIQIMKWIAKNGEGSYGLLYVLDEEDKRKNYSENFRVWVLKRGNLIETEDPFLSPFIPECEKI